MKDELRQERQAEIAEAAYELLKVHGYGGTSMLRIAKAARASNETLYRWYGDKDGLFIAMVRDNAREVRQMLEDALEHHGDPLESLSRIAPVFLSMLLGDRAILLNRAAAADASGALGNAIAAGGRDEIMPLIARLMRQICAGHPARTEEATDWFLSLLVGDQQIKRILMQTAAPSPGEIAERCTTAMTAFRRLLGD